MGKFNRWVRQIHRLLGFPLAVVLILLIVNLFKGPESTTPEWMSTFGILSILSLVVTGLILFIQHYGGRVVRSLRRKKDEKQPVLMSEG